MSDTMFRFAMLGTLAVLLFSPTACNTSDATRVPDVEYPPRPADWPVDVFIHPFAPGLLIDAVGKRREGSGPPDAEVIGDFKVKQVDYTSSRKIPLRAAIAAAKLEARGIGGDAIVIREGRAGLDGSELQGEILRYPE